MVGTGAGAGLDAGPHREEIQEDIIASVTRRNEWLHRFAIEVLALVLRGTGERRWSKLNFWGRSLDPALQWGRFIGQLRHSLKSIYANIMTTSLSQGELESRNSIGISF